MPFVRRILHDLFNCELGFSCPETTFVSKQDEWWERGGEDGQDGEDKDDELGVSKRRVRRGRGLQLGSVKKGFRRFTVKVMREEMCRLGYRTEAKSQGSS